MNPPLLCDLCSTKVTEETLVWNYRTPRTADTPEQAINGLFWCEDEEWLVCMDCHLLIEADNKEGLLLRSLEVQSAQIVVIGDLPPDIWEAAARGIARSIDTFWAHKSVHPPTPERSGDHG